MRNKRLRFVFILLVSATAATGKMRAEDAALPLPDLAPTEEYHRGQTTELLLDEVDKASADQTRLEKETVTVNASRTATRDVLKSQTRSLYHLLQSGLFSLSGGVNSLMLSVARVERLKHMVRANIERLRQLDRQSALVERQSAELAASLEQTRKRLIEAQKTLLPFPVAPAVSSGDDSLPSSQGGFREPNGERGFYGLRLVDDNPETTFARERGNLAMPVAGEFAVREARREESDGPGLEFLARAGTTVRSVAAGRVAFSDLYGSYGRLVILDHGDNYYTVYGGLGNVEVRVGDDLSRGARVGTIAGNRSESALFFEVRRGTRALPPRSWLGL
jgi:murein DD-endopeptidase MepM/ murein hydrolase activator NlpD